MRPILLEIAMRPILLEKNCKFFGGKFSRIVLHHDYNE